MKNQLTEYPIEHVDVYINYIDNLKTEKDDKGGLKNYWAPKIKDIQYINVFKKTASKGMFIDGDSITLTWRKKLVVTFDYHAYKNKVLSNYPESIFDFGIVYDGDDFSFKKESGKVIYSHTKNNPFDTNKKIIGSYGIIKNSKGEFLETLNMDDITKMKNSSNMQFIWNNWFDRMVLKSVIKRICSVHFYDIVKDIDSIDNETNDPDNCNVPSSLQEEIVNCKTKEELAEHYNANIDSVEDAKSYIKLLTERKKEVVNG